PRSGGRWRRQYCVSWLSLFEHLGLERRASFLALCRRKLLQPSFLLRPGAEKALLANRERRLRLIHRRAGRAWLRAPFELLLRFRWGSDVIRRKRVRRAHPLDYPSLSVLDGAVPRKRMDRWWSGVRVRQARTI